ncbi:hypothetical protein [Nocardia brevicatena]|uniref:hypothetical protein n=1 Tax=Nocardia brevicatena TaxID=37327 RepID=UPI0002D8FA3A|nr:hypothetical protein [Nocardia brevicatena]
MIAQPEDIADAVCRPASDESRFVTATSVSVDLGAARYGSPPAGRVEVRARPAGPWTSGKDIDMALLADRVAVITGGAQGIGLTIARASCGKAPAW